MIRSGEKFLAGLGEAKNMLAGKRGSVGPLGVGGRTCYQEGKANDDDMNRTLHKKYKKKATPPFSNAVTISNRRLNIPCLLLDTYNIVKVVIELILLNGGAKFFEC